MISLFLDTSLNRLIIGIYKDKKEIYFENIETNNDLSGKVLDHLDKILNDLKLSIKDINEVYVVNGPGSFTGIRIGVTISKVLASALNIKIYEISELQLLASTPIKNRYVVPMIDARRGFVYGAMYNKNLKNLIEDQYISKEELIKKSKELKKEEDIAFVSYDYSDMITPNIDIEKLLDKVKFKEVNPHKVNPNYLKKTEAEEKLNDKKN